MAELVLMIGLARLLVGFLLRRLRGEVRAVPVSTRSEPV